MSNDILTTKLEEVKRKMLSTGARGANQERIGFQKKKWLKKPIFWLPVALLFVLAVSFSAFALLKKGPGQVENVFLKKQVEVMTVDQTSGPSASIEAVGLVKPSSQVEAVSLAKGAVAELNFKIGSWVNQGQVLAVLNSQTAAESLKTAQASLAQAKDNLENAQALQIKTSQDASNQAVISAGHYLNFIKTTLDQINFIIKAEGQNQLANIEAVLAAKDSQSLITAQNSYLSAKANYQETEGLRLNKEDITEQFKKILNCLYQVRQAVSDTVVVLDNTVTSFSFSENQLSAQKTIFAGLLSSVVNAITTAESQFQGLQNIELVNKRELDALTNALKLAQSQLVLVEISQANLKITAPLAGRITAKYVEVGSEINPGQAVAQISQTSSVKVEVDLLPQDARNLVIGQRVLLEGDLAGWVSLIAPTVDSLTRKVKVDLTYPNQDNSLLVGSFVKARFSFGQISKQDKNAFLIPLKALNINPSGAFVFLLKEGKAVQQAVAVGQNHGAWLEITEGLIAGDTLITEGSKRLVDGEEVAVVNVELLAN